MKTSAIRHTEPCWIIVQVRLCFGKSIQDVVQSYLRTNLASGIAPEFILDRLLHQDYSWWFDISEVVVQLEPQI
jgi:hypothetical protein